MQDGLLSDVPEMRRRLQMGEGDPNCNPDFRGRNNVRSGMGWTRSARIVLEVRAVWPLVYSGQQTSSGIATRKRQQQSTQNSITMENTTSQSRASGDLLHETVRPLERLHLSQTNRPVDVINYWRTSNGMLLDAPYQRGDVWGNIRRRNLIRSIMLGIPIPSIIINDRASAGWDDLITCAVIDGKQRITAIMLFLTDELDVPGAWFGIDSENVLFSEIPIVGQRRFRNQPIPFTEGQLRSLEEEREVFELVNYGGVPQGESDILSNEKSSYPKD